MIDYFDRELSEMHNETRRVNSQMPVLPVKYHNVHTSPSSTQKHHFNGDQADDDEQ